MNWVAEIRGEGERKGGDRDEVEGRACPAPTGGAMSEAAIGASGPGGMNPSPTSLEIGHSSRFNDVLSMIATLTSDGVLE